VGLICARGGSKGIPKKNVKPLGGKPLIGWSIEIAKQCNFIDRIVISTDNAEIASVSRSFGAEVPFMRPKELAGDNAPEWSVWQHAMQKLEELDNFRADYVIVLPPTSPFRSNEDIKYSMDIIIDETVDMVISVTESGRNPYFNMVELDSQGWVHLSKTPNQKVIRRQAAPPVYDMTTVLYTTRPNFILKASGVLDGNVKALVIPEIRAVDIDTRLDFAFAEFLISGKYL
jgi:N-acylneuraminate cytidylyltransferase